MKCPKIVGALGLLVGFCCLGPAQAKAAAQAPSHPAPTFSIVLTGPVSPVPLNWPVNVKWSVTNTTNHAIGWAIPWSTSKDAGYLQFSYMLEKDGHEVATTFFDRKISGRVRPDDPRLTSADLRGSTVLVPRPPGKIFDMGIDLKRLYKITEPGTYTFQVSRYDVSKTLVKSNTITITVTGPSQAPPPQAAVPLPVAAGTPYVLAINTAMPGNIPIKVGASYAYPVIGPQDTFKAGSEIALDISVTNTSGHQIEYDPGITSLVFDVKDAEGKPVPLTPGGQDLRKQYGIGHGQVIPVPQDKTASAGEVIISGLYDLSQPGVYTIQVSRFDSETKTWVKSNTITLTVTP